MRTIYQLSDAVVAKIAAGEVIERPAYAVKELVENAIDAQAQTITISIENSGLKKITVIDDGIGMNKADLLESYKPHTTSKLKPDDDFFAITSFGFRGEALASIASVSTVTIKSRAAQSSGGNQITLIHGKLKDCSPVGMPKGTHVIVSHLFSNIPARKKFLKSLRIELHHIIETISHIALAHPHIRFIFTHDKKVLLDISKTNDLSQRIKQIFGADFLSHLLPVQFSDDYLTITGFLLHPQFAHTQPKQLIFVNQRNITDKTINATIRQSYGTLLQSHTYPSFILFFSLPKELVDVNIHPRKEQVNFMYAQQVHDSLAYAIQKLLTEKNLTFAATAWQKELKTGGTDSFIGNLLKQSDVSWKLPETTMLQSTNVLPLHKLYIIAGEKNGLVLIDQHAAHERILYEQYFHTFHNIQKQKKSRKLQKQIILHVSLEEIISFHEQKKILENMGFVIKQSENTIFVTAVPEFINEKNLSEIFPKLLKEFAATKDKHVIDAFAKKMIAYIACRSAIKAGDIITKQQATSLIKQLEKTPHNTTCPHGRPTKIFLPLEQIHALFKRYNYNPRK